MDRPHNASLTEPQANPGDHEMTTIPVPQPQETSGLLGHVPENACVEDGTYTRKSPASRVLCAYPWTLEFVACVVGVGCLTAIVGIICRVDGKPSPLWYLGQLAISVNAVVALLAEVAKMCVTMVSGSLLAQFKWEWFEGAARFLYDLKRYDDASHGEWGSFRLLFSKKARLKDRILALVMVTSLLTAPITQQTLEYRTALVPANDAPGIMNATVPVVNHLTRWNVTFAPRDGDRNLLTNAIVSSAYELNQIIHLVEPTCGSADCTWPDYASLGICSGVKNITSLARSSPQILLLAKERIDRLFNPAYSNPSSPLYVPESYTSTNILVSSPLWTPTGVWDEPVMQNMHANLFVAYADEPVSMATGFDPAQLARFQFLDVALYWCITQYTTTYTTGVAKTVELASHARLAPESLTRIASTLPNSPRLGALDTFYNADFSKACYSPRDDGPACVGFGGVDIVLEPPPGTPQVYAVDLWTALAASYLTYFTLTGGLLQMWGLTEFAREGDVALALSAAIFGDRFGLAAYPREEQLVRMERLVGNIARGLSNGLRILAGADGIGENAQVVRGTVLVQQTVLVYEWRWLTWLAVQLALVTGILLWTVWNRRGGTVPVMKDSILAVADIFGRADEFRSEDPRTQDELERVAKRSRAVLDVRDDGLVMVRWRWKTLKTNENGGSEERSDRVNGEQESEESGRGRDTDDTLHETGHTSSGNRP